MKKLVVLLCALLALGSSAQALEVSAPSALLMEKETGTVLFAKDEHAKLEPASVTKVMTLLLCRRQQDRRKSNGESGPHPPADSGGSKPALSSPAGTAGIRGSTWQSKPSGKRPVGRCVRR